MPDTGTPRKSMSENNILPEILIIDDSENLDIVKKMLSADRFILRDANSYESAVSNISLHKVDLIVLRWKTRSDSICRQLKSNQQTKEIPLLLLIASDSKHEIGAGLQAGADDYILIPFSDDELQLRINIHLRLKKVREDLTRSRESAEASAKAKAMFLTNISHEIRTPMNGIIGMTDILKQTQLNSDQLEYLEIIRLSGENLLMLINDVLDFSKIEAGQITFEQIRFDLFDVVNEVVKILWYKAEQKHIDFSAHFSPDVPEFVIGDPLRLKQILINLCSNAIKFTNRGFVKIKVSLRESKNSTIRLFFEVEDTGIGIPEKNQSKLFQTFTQAEASTTRKFGGTGLGLAICRNLVELMNGKIGVYSEAGVGSNFYFDGEFGKIEATDTENPANAIGVSSEVRKLKILLAEDNIINQKVAILNLKKLGHEVVWTNDGKEALEKFYSETPDVVFMDVKMAGMDGLEATRKIREWEKINHVEKPVPIVAMTAHTLQSDKKLFFDSGMNDFLDKPFNWNDLINVLDRIKSMIEDKNKNISIWNSVK